MSTSAATDKNLVKQRAKLARLQKNGKVAQPSPNVELEAAAAGLPLVNKQGETVLGVVTNMREALSMIDTRLTHTARTLQSYAGSDPSKLAAAFTTSTAAVEASRTRQADAPLARASADVQRLLARVARVHPHIYSVRQLAQDNTYYSHRQLAAEQAGGSAPVGKAAARVQRKRERALAGRQTHDQSSASILSEMYCIHKDAESVMIGVLADVSSAAAAFFGTAGTMYTSTLVPLISEAQQLQAALKVEASPAGRQQAAVASAAVVRSHATAASAAQAAVMAAVAHVQPLAAGAVPTFVMASVDSSSSPHVSTSALGQAAGAAGGSAAQPSSRLPTSSPLPHTVAPHSTAAASAAPAAYGRGAGTAAAASPLGGAASAAPAAHGHGASAAAATLGGLGGAAAAAPAAARFAGGDRGAPQSAGAAAASSSSSLPVAPTGVGAPHAAYAAPSDVALGGSALPPAPDGAHWVRPSAGGAAQPDDGIGGAAAAAAQQPAPRPSTGGLPYIANGNGGGIGVGGGGSGIGGGGGHGVAASPTSHMVSTSKTALAVGEVAPSGAGGVMPNNGNDGGGGAMPGGYAGGGQGYGNQTGANGFNGANVNGANVNGANVNGVNGGGIGANNGVAGRQTAAMPPAHVGQLNAAPVVGTSPATANATKAGGKPHWWSKKVVVKQVAAQHAPASIPIANAV